MKALTRRRGSFLRENRVFHSIIARASGNKVLEMFWSTISILASGEQQGMRYPRRNQAHIIKRAQAHPRGVPPARRGDAASSDASHLGELENLVRRRYQDHLKQPTGIACRPRARHHRQISDAVLDTAR